MNIFRRKISKAIIGAALMAAPMAGLSSCDGAIYDNLAPCPEGLKLRFVYDYNMEFANAFHSQVHCLTLFVYDEQGRCMAQRTENAADVLSDENYRMTLDLPAGKYTCVAYGGMECAESSFSFKPAPEKGALLTDLRVEMKPDAPGTDLHQMFYGSTTVEVPNGATDYTEATLPMMKDTNNLRILLQHLSGKPVNVDDFKFTVTENNTLFNYDNALLPAPMIDFDPWVTGQITTGEYDPDSDGGDHQSEPGVTLAYAEFGLSRLVVPQKDPSTGLRVSPRLIITRAADGAKVVDIPLIDYLLLLKSDRYKSMGAQEFLDRESRWSMIFFLDKANHWVSTHIVINDWVVRINNAEL